MHTTQAIASAGTKPVELVLTVRIEPNSLAAFAERIAEIVSTTLLARAERADSLIAAITPGAQHWRHERPGDERGSRRDDAAMVDAKRVAKLLGVCTRHLSNLVATGRLMPPIRFGKRAVRWDLEQLRTWIRAGCPRVNSPS